MPASTSILWITLSGWGSFEIFHSSFMAIRNLLKEVSDDFSIFCFYSDVQVLNFGLAYLFFKSDAGM